MACLISISFSVPPCSKTLIQESFPGRSALGTILCPVISRTANKLCPTSCSSRRTYSVNRSFHHHTLTPSSHFCELLLPNLNESSITHSVILGFWVGPDIEDGWGFVEAYVNTLI